AEIEPDDIDHVNAHGAGTVDGDAWEAGAINEVLSACNRPIPVFAAKSYIGNLGAAGATTELAASLLGFKNGVVPVTLNYEEPDPACPVDVVAGTARPVRQKHVLKIGCTAMGQCAALVCRNWTE